MLHRRLIPALLSLFLVLGLTVGPAHAALPASYVIPRQSAETLTLTASLGSGLLQTSGTNVAINAPRTFDRGQLLWKTHVYFWGNGRWNHIGSSGLMLLDYQGTTAEPQRSFNFSLHVPGFYTYTYEVRYYTTTWNGTGSNYADRETYWPAPDYPTFFVQNQVGHNLRGSTTLDQWIAVPSSTLSAASLSDGVTMDAKLASDEPTLEEPELVEDEDGRTGSLRPGRGQGRGGGPPGGQ